MPVAALSRADAHLTSVTTGGPFEGRALPPPVQLRGFPIGSGRHLLDKPPSASSRAIDRHAYATEHRSSHLRTLLAVLSDPITSSGNSPTAPKDSIFNQLSNTISVSQNVSHHPNRDDYNMSSCSENLQPVPSPPLSAFPAIPLSPDLQNAVYSTDPSTYARICEPISEWLAEYMWKVVTTGLSLPCSFVNSGFRDESLPTKPDAILADSICSLLLSTLLQPSVIVLALHYISRLPACVTHCAFEVRPSSTKEHLFYSALTCVDTVARDNANSQALYAAFKLFVVASILSNKILDDHVFTLKTWHEVSGIPLKSLNRLEWLTLDLLGHDLCVDTPAWDYWLTSVKNYHIWLCAQDNCLVGDGLSMPLMSFILDSLVSSGGYECAPRHPIFLGLDERIRVTELQYLPKGMGTCTEFDSEDEGPLREEYVPKRGLSLPAENTAGLHSRVGSWDREHAFPSSTVSRSTPNSGNTPGAQHCPVCQANSSPWPPSPLDPYPTDTYPAVEGWEQHCWEDAHRIPVPHSMFDSSACSIVGFSNRSCGKEYTLRDYFLSYTRSTNWVPA